MYRNTASAYHRLERQCWESRSHNCIQVAYAGNPSNRTVVSIAITRAASSKMASYPERTAGVWNCTYAGAKMWSYIGVLNKRLQPRVTAVSAAIAGRNISSAVVRAGIRRHSRWHPCVSRAHATCTKKDRQDSCVETQLLFSSTFFLPV